MDRIAIIGANEFQMPLIIKARVLGLETHVFAWEDGAIGKDFADYFYPISTAEKEKILTKCQAIGVSAIVSIGSDFAVHTVNYVSRAMGFPCNSLECENNATNKYVMRRAFLKAGIPVPKFTATYRNFDIDSLQKYTFPLIIKPTDRSGSRGIMKISTLDEIKDAVANACDVSWEHRAIVEEFIDGDEYSCECISYMGEHHLLAYTKKFTTGAPHFIETGHVQPSGILEAVKPYIQNTIYKALDALNIKYGASHTEFKILRNGEIRIIEIGARMGGDCIGSDLVPISTGYDFVRMVIDVACDKKPDITPITIPQRAEVRFICNERDLEALNAIKRTKPERIVHLSRIEQIKEGSITDSSSRFGYYILVG